MAVAFKMVKRLAAITASPYGIFVSEKPVTGNKTAIHLTKLNKVERLKEGTRFSENGLNCCTTIIKSWWLDSQEEVNATIDHIIDEWTQNKKKQDAV
ncbi:TPA: hypothetical protein P0E36_004893 [Vibrio harveyi]|nr:hypothetical protein [Vibrio harveyi]